MDDEHGCASSHLTQCCQLVAEKRCWRVFRSRSALSERQSRGLRLIHHIPDVGYAARYGVGVWRRARGPTNDRRFPWLLRGGGGHVLQEATRFEAELLRHMHVGGRKRQRRAAPFIPDPFSVSARPLTRHYRG